jgi:hypothetical protein
MVSSRIRQVARQLRQAARQLRNSALAARQQKESDDDEDPMPDGEPTHRIFPPCVASACFFLFSLRLTQIDGRDITPIRDQNT